MDMNNEQNYPPLSQQVKNLAKFTFKLINYIQENEDHKSLISPDRVYNERIEICRSCEKYDKEQNRCFECGCYLPAKAKAIFEECPLNKWQTKEEDLLGVYETIINDMEENSK